MNYFIPQQFPRVLKRFWFRGNSYYGRKSTWVSLQKNFNGIKRNILTPNTNYTPLLESLNHLHPQRMKPLSTLYYFQC